MRHKIFSGLVGLAGLLGSNGLASAQSIALTQGYYRTPILPPDCPTPPAVIPSPLPKDWRFPIPTQPPPESKTPSTEPKESPQKAPESKDTTPQPKDQLTPQTNPSMTDAPQSPQAFAEAPSAGTGATGSFSPSMFGDQFGGRRIPVTIQGPTTAIPESRRSFAGLIESPPGNTAVFTVPFPGGTGTNLAFSGNNLFLNGIALGSATFSSAGPVFGTPQQVALSENPQVTQSIQSGAATGKEVAQFINGTALQTTSQFDYNIEQVYDLVVPAQVLHAAPIIFSVPNPAGGGAVGRTRVYEDSSPMPRDRLIFDYDFFANTALTDNGFDVHRYTFGFEKTFFDGLTSIDVRLPFASTLAATETIGTQTTNTQFGNVFVTLKGLLYRSESLYVSTGVGLSLPTASDTVVRFNDAAQTELIRIRNQSVLVEPYVAFLWMPDDRTFWQNWINFSFDTAGNTVVANVDLNGLQNVGKIYDQPTVGYQTQFGYWLVRNDDYDAILRGLAPFIELHYNKTMSGPKLIQTASFQIGDLTNHNDDLNLTVGGIARFGNNLIVSTAAVVPLLGGDNKSFDYQVGLRVNYFYGYTARQNNPAAYTP